MVKYVPCQTQSQGVYLEATVLRIFKKYMLATGSECTGPWPPVRYVGKATYYKLPKCLPISIIKNVLGWFL